jgi:hypothetical protein
MHETKGKQKVQMVLIRAKDLGVKSEVSSVKLTKNLAWQALILEKDS